MGRISQKRDPFKVLVACMLSLRTKDETTDGAVARLFSHYQTPQEFTRASEKELERLIFPVGFYRIKAKNLKEVARILIKENGAKVPDEMEKLLQLPGVGRKTANLVLIKGYDKPGICVDTHVHRIVNRWGYLETRSPEETEQVLRACLPRRYWKTINDLLVRYGQLVCTPVSPFCSRCLVKSACAQRGVKRWR